MNTKRTPAEVAAFRAAHNAPVSYDISINEEQRRILYAALRNVPSLALLARSSNSNVEEITLLRDMLASLPQSEAETPGALHGFCF